MLIAAIDIGSSVVKASVIDPRGAVRGHASARTRVSFGVEMDADDLTESPLDVLAGAVARSGADAGEVAAVAVTGSRGTVLPLDRDGRPIGRAAMWTDTRGGEDLGRFVDRCGGRAAVTARTGLVPDTTLSAASILHWRSTGDAAGSAARFAGPQAAALERMTGRCATDRTHAAHYGFFSLDGTDWDRDLCAAADLRPDRLPELVAPGSVVGPLRAEAARRTGLRPGTPVVAAGSDAVCYKLGAGVVEPGDATVSVGTAATFAVMAAAPYADPTGLLSCTAAVRPGLWEVFGIQPSGAAMLEWLRDMFGAAGAPSLDDLIRDAGAVPPGADGLTVVPYLVGAGVPQQRSAAAMFAGLRPAHGRAHFARAVMEGVAFALLDTLGALTASGHPPGLVRMVGGAARSEAWAQTLSDVLAMPIETLQAEEPGLLGAAIVGTVSADIHPTLPEAVGAMTRVRRRYEPRPATAQPYARAYERFRRAEAAARAFDPAATTQEQP